MEYWNVGIRQYWVKKQIGNDKIQMPNQIQTPKRKTFITKARKDQNTKKNDILLKPSLSDFGG
jgi:hypothetical protein